MSTIFGIIIHKGKLLDLPQNQDFIDENKLFEDLEGDIDTEEIAFRSSKGVRWLNSLAPFLPPETKVYALDNSQQGIYTIQDILKEIEDENSGT